MKELAKQVGIWFEDTKEIRTHAVSTTTLEKFAEAIIKDNARFIDEYADREGKDLLEHYGVKNEPTNF